MHGGSVGYGLGWVSYLGWVGSMKIDPRTTLHAGNASKLMTVESCGFHFRVDQELYLFVTDFHTLGPRGTPITRASNETVVGINRENAKFRQINRYIHEMIEDRRLITIENS